MNDPFSNIYDGCRVLVTGHTGFKGSWLCRWLELLGANVTGYALPPHTIPNHHTLLKMSHSSILGDIRDEETVKKAMMAVKPEIVFHLAAQPLVRQSYREPLETYSTNTLGTAVVLDACRVQSSIKAIVVVTTDKCYQNREWPWAYREIDTLGGHDPYSASKACAELVVSSYRNSYFKEAGILLASVRAGNVIGGGDWAEDRLIPDLVRSVETGQALQIRNPDATRPWQHVLEPLSGYLLLGKLLLDGRSEFAEPWNFSPWADSNLRVRDMIQLMQYHWPNITWEYPELPTQPHEANFLMLDSSKANCRLGWKPIWSIDSTLANTAKWYRAYYEDNTIITDDQISLYVKDLMSRG